MKEIDERLGVIGFNKYGSKMQVVKYNKEKDILVKFLEHGNLVHTSWSAFSRGLVKNVYDKSFLGIGYIGEGKYKSTENKKTTPQYNSWCHMMRRCYCDKHLEKHPTYKNITVSNEWHNFQNFAVWFDENYYEIDSERICLDKDIIQKGNKEYSPNYCVFVPERINILFVKQNSKRGNLPIGVTYEKGNNKYIAKCKNGKETIYLGQFYTPEDAFKAYKKYKENIIKQVAEDYREKIPNKLYEAMLRYKVDIND